MRMFCPAFFLVAFSLHGEARADEPRRALRASDVEEASLRDQYRQMARENHGHSITFLKELIADTEPGARRAEMILRLAEMYFQEARYQALVEDDPEAAAEWMRSAARLYEHLADAYPSFERADEASFYLASARQELGELDAALVAWLRFVRAHPDSPLVSDAYVQIGEHYFDRGDVFKALQAYTHAVEGPTTTLRDYARFQIAWCYYNLGEYEQALNHTAALVTEGGAMRDDALGALARFSAEHHGDVGALAPLERLPLADSERQVLSDGIAEVLKGMGRHQDAALVWSRLLATYPSADAADGWFGKMVDIHIQRADYTAALTLLEGDAAQQWSGARADKLRAVAVAAHTEARKRGGAARFALAGRAYGLWLADYPEHDNVLDVRYAYGELLYDTKQHAAAYEQYRIVAASDSEHATFCAEAALFAADALLKTAPPPSPDGTRPIPLGPATERYMAAAAVYLSGTVSGEKAQKVAYRVAWQLYNHNHFTEAAPRFEAVIAADPAASEAEQAAHLIMDGLAIQEEWATLQAVASRLRDLDGLGGPRFSQEAQGIYEGAAFQVIAQSAEYDPVGAASAWMGFASAHPESALAPKALNNAAVSYHAAHLRADAIAARETLLGRYPEAPFAAEQMAALGYDRESIADFEAAADWYERLFAEHPAHTAAADALYSAGLFRRSLSDTAAAVQDWTAFARAFPDDPRVPGVLLDVAQLHVQAEDWRAASALYQRYADSPPAGAVPEQQAFARLALGRVLAAQGRHAAAVSALEAVADAGGATGAEARFLLAERQRGAYDALRIDRVERIDRQTVAMVSGLKEMESVYGAVLDVGELKWGLAAAVRLGGAYEHLAGQLREAPIPELTVAQEQLYREQIEDLIWTMESKASALYEQALSRSFAQHAYDESTAVALGRLQTLQPTAYPALSEELIRASFTAGSASSGVGLLETSGLPD